MSRIGKMPISLPDPVKISVQEDQVEIQGPKGTLTAPVPKGISCSLEDKVLTVTRASEEKPVRALHGLTRALIANAVEGVTKGYQRELDIVGVGYRANVEGKKVVFSIGYSHPIEFEIPDGIAITVDKQTHVTVTGCDKQLVGQVAAKIRSFKKPEPYKGKGIMYTNEHIIRKAGKAAK
ncbi:MAG: 50S ribosomal protein L6 [Acidobacteriota bacterium]|jgi:large subunit ribosomal protein L6